MAGDGAHSVGLQRLPAAHGPDGQTGVSHQIQSAASIEGNACEWLRLENSNQVVSLPN